MAKKKATKSNLPATILASVDVDGGWLQATTVDVDGVAAFDDGAFVGEYQLVKTYRKTAALVPVE